MDSSACQPRVIRHPFTPRLNRILVADIAAEVRQVPLSTLEPKWTESGTAPPKVTLPSGDSTPRLSGVQRPLSHGFLSNLRDFLAERPVKVPKNGKGGVFTSEGFGSGLAENLKEWFKPTPRAVRGAAASRMVVDWQPFYKVFFQNIRDLISPPKLPSDLIFPFPQIK